MRNVIESQRKYFLSGATMKIEGRINNLKALDESIRDNMQPLLDAFMKDFNKNSFDAISTEIGLVLNEIKFFIKNLSKLSKPRKIHTSLINFPSKGFIMPEPYGVTLIVSPWNYPFQLSLMPLIGAIACGNTVILKPSANTKNISMVIEKILSIFDKELVYVTYFDKDRELLFDMKYDYVFYTGSPNVARLVMEKQSKFLTPMTLELGGKSPCIIDKTANIDLSAKRVVWGKFVNAGQTCVAPDYILVDSTIKEKWLEKVIYYIKKFYYEDDKLSKNFTHVVNLKHTERIKSLIDVSNEKVILGGRYDGTEIEPTIIDNVSFDDEIMKDEIFAPIMPIITFDNLNEMMVKINQLEKPLAFYYFGKDMKFAKQIMYNTHFGGGCVNDTIMHVSEHKLPFGGVGNSGMGSYHGKKSFDTFTHFKSVLFKSYSKELNLKYPPITNKKFNLIKFFFGIK